MPSFCGEPAAPLNNTQSCSSRKSGGHDTLITMAFSTFVHILFLVVGASVKFLMPAFYSTSDKFCRTCCASQTTGRIEKFLEVTKPFSLTGYKCKIASNFEVPRKVTSWLFEVLHANGTISCTR